MLVSLVRQIKTSGVEDAGSVMNGLWAPTRRAQTMHVLLAQTWHRKHQDPGANEYNWKSGTLQLLYKNLKDN